MPGTYIGDLGLMCFWVPWWAYQFMNVYDISGWVGFTSLSHIPLKMLAEDQKKQFEGDCSRKEVQIS